MKRIAKRLLVLATLIANSWLGVVWAQISSVTPSPTSVGFSITVNLPTIKLTPAVVATLPKTSTVALGDLLPASTLPTVNVSPSALMVSWGVTIPGPTTSYTSSFGSFVLSGATVATSAVSIVTTGVPGPTVVTEPETVTLPLALKTALATKLLETPVPNPLFASSPSSVNVSATIPVDYTRRWITGLGAVTPATVKLNFSTSFLLKLDATVLKSVTASPSKANAVVAMQNSTSVSTTYRAELTKFGLGSPVTVSSSGATFRTASGRRLGSTSKSLRQGPVSSGPVLFPTVESIPAAVVQAAFKANVSHFFIVRPFTAGGGVTKEARVTVALAGRSGAGFQITRVELRFKAGERIKIFPRNARPEYILDIKYVGSGIAQIDCRGSGVTPASGRPLFRRTRVIRQYFDPSGRKVIVCPGVPGNDVGAYFGSALFVNPKVTFVPPIIRWWVGDDEATQAQSQAQEDGFPLIELISPASKSLIDRDTRFSWNAKGTDVLFYRLEFFKKPNTDSAPVTGTVVDATQKSAAVSGVMLDNLVEGKTYYVRILGLNEDGVVVEASSFREVGH